ncbi:MAG: glycosyltransferase, partial [Candidatus Omnitrophica bacterium]|nr:glycosyltransferase [Candidatus Omnitrophota bacterium]
MNVLILATHLNPGGVSRYVINLAQGLTRRGNTVWVASGGGTWVSLLSRYGVQHKNIPIFTKAIVSFQVFFSFLALTSFLKKHNIQIIHANTRVTQCLAYLLWKSLHIPYVSALHGFYRPSGVRTFAKFEGIAAIAVSVAVKKHCIDDLKIPQEKIYVVHNGIRLEDFSVKKKQKSDFGFNESDYCLGILGRISEEKGHFLAAQALEKLMQKNQNLYLLIAGKGKMEDALKTFV